MDWQIENRCSSLIKPQLVPVAHLLSILAAWTDQKHPEDNVILF
jgi:hypothetical protein